MEYRIFITFLDAGGNTLFTTEYTDDFLAITKLIKKEAALHKDLDWKRINVFILKLGA